MSAWLDDQGADWGTDTHKDRFAAGFCAVLFVMTVCIIGWLWL